MLGFGCGTTTRKSASTGPAEEVDPAAKPALRDFVAAYAKAWGKGGPLEQRGLVPLGGADAAAAGKQASELKPLDPATLK